MRSPAELDDVPWHDLTHAYGSAEDVPQLIRALYEDDQETVDEAIYELYGNIHHQGTVYPASAPAVPFLAHAACHVPGKREDLLMLLATLADNGPGDSESPHWPGSVVAAICAELARVFPELLPHLDDTDRGIRRAVLRVIAAVAGSLHAELRAEVLARVDVLYATDPVAAVRADAMVVRVLSGGSEVEALDSPLPEVRLAAAVLAAERSGPPYAPRLVEILTEDGADPDPGDDNYPWPGTSSQDQHLTGLLSQDPDAALTIAAGWIAAGDIGSRGSWIARQIMETWRGREPQALDLLLAALPHQGEAGGPAHGLSTIARWVRHVPEPGAALRDALYEYARTEQGESAEAALLALTHSRDPRALDLVLVLDLHCSGAQTLQAAALSFPEAGDRLIPAIRSALAAGATGNDAIHLVAALERFGTAAGQAQPELVDCLRTGRGAVVAARLLGRVGTPSTETTSALLEAAQSTDASLSIAAAVAHYQHTGEADPALRTFETLLATAKGPTHWYLAGLTPLGSAAAPLLPTIEPLLTARYDWTRMAAAEAHHAITGSPDRAVPVLAELISAAPVGLSALKALAAIGEVPEHLRPTLRAFAFSPLRLLSDTPFSEETHADEELRALAWRLLTDG
ncbi:hypothetical protein ACIGFK_19145 [Streptomyces sp. NPDC085524]|uniref:hypothetical protein n=1 Tax=Streptomyces sp. NPDC085524 TaxID=3365728 RepID=UPI0037D220DA